MVHLIDKDALVAEINKRIMDAPINHIGHQRVWAYNDVKDILNTLEAKEVDLNEEINKWQGCEAFPEGVGITPLPKAMEIVERTAKHFFELGVNKVQKGE